MDTHGPGNGAEPTTGRATLGADAALVLPKPVTLRGSELAERIERHFPHELRAIPRWVGWRWERKEDGTWTKPPIRIDGAWYASTTKPETWTTFERAIAALKNPGCTLDGIGLVPNERIAGVDVDHPLDHQTTKLILRSFLGTYCERSPRGKLRVWCFGRPKHNGRNAAAEVEVYGGAGRYLTVTGDHIEESSIEAVDQQEALDWLNDRFFPQAPAPQQQPSAR